MSSPVSVAVLGLSGLLGPSVLTALKSPTFSSKINFPIIAVSREKLKSTETTHYVQFDLSDPEELAKNLQGVDVIIELLLAKLSIFSTVEKAVSIVKPKLFIPSQFGSDIQAVQEYVPDFLSMKTEHPNIARAAGVKTVEFATGHFAIPGSYLYEFVENVGIDTKNNTYTVRGGTDLEVSVSTANDIGNTVAAVVTFNISKLPDTIRVHSEKVSIQKIIDTYEKNHNVKLTKKATYTAAESLKALQESWAKGFDHEKFFFYIHCVTAQGVNKGNNFGHTERELVNPGESLWKWAKF